MKIRTVNILIIAPLHTALTVQVYWSNERNELNEVDELHEVDDVNELDELDSARTVPEWSTLFSKWKVLHSFTRVK